MALFWNSVFLALCFSSITITWVNAAVLSTKEISRPFGSLETDNLKPLPGLNSREDEEEEEEFTTVKGPGHEGILKGLSGIFAGVVNGNLNGIVQSSFEFVPKAHHPNVNKVYGSLLGKTDPPPTTARPTLRSVVAQNNVNEESGGGGGGGEVEEEEDTGTGSGTVTSAPIRKRPLPVRRPIRPVNPDDEEEESEFLERRTPRPRPNIRYRPRPVAENQQPKATEAPSEDYSV